ncbi:hypothetical protein DAI43_06760, partial [Achromobacter xylosoxidans]
KGLMNRAHAYKASVDQNTEKGLEPDDGVTMGLFSYPVLMAARQIRHQIGTLFRLRRGTTVI